MIVWVVPFIVRGRYKDAHCPSILRLDRARSLEGSARDRAKTGERQSWQTHRRLVPGDAAAHMSSRKSPPPTD